MSWPLFAKKQMTRLFDRPWPLFIAKFIVAAVVFIGRSKDWHTRVSSLRMQSLKAD
jgi:hypothetical protein